MPPTSIPTSPPERITPNSQVQWTVDLADFNPATDTLTFVFLQAAVQTKINATASGGLFLVTLTATDTADFTAGILYYQAYVTSGGIRYQLNGDNGLPFHQGRMTVDPDFDDADAGADVRSHVKKVLDALDATILGKASKDQLSYSIAGRSLSRMNADELIRWQDRYRTLYAQEVAAERKGQGKGSGRTVKYRFVKPS